MFYFPRQYASRGTAGAFARCRTVPTADDERPAGFWRHFSRTLAKATSVRIRNIIRTPRVQCPFRTRLNGLSAADTFSIYVAAAGSIRRRRLCPVRRRTQSAVCVHASRSFRPYTAIVHVLSCA